MNESSIVTGKNAKPNSAILCAKRKKKKKKKQTCDLKIKYLLNPPLSNTYTQSPSADHSVNYL